MFARTFQPSPCLARHYVSTILNLLETILDGYNASCIYPFSTRWKRFHKNLLLAVKINSFSSNNSASLFFFCCCSTNEAPQKNILLEVNLLKQKCLIFLQLNKNVEINSCVGTWWDNWISNFCYSTIFKLQSSFLLTNRSKYKIILCFTALLKAPVFLEQ